VEQLAGSREPVEGRLAYPVDVDLEVTGRCNMRCVHCYSRASPLGPPGPRMGEVEALAGELGGGGAMRVLVGGGEPLLREDIVEVVERFTRAGVAVNMSSNGFFFTESLGAELYGAGRSERLLGEALHRHGVAEEAFIVTKVAGYRVTRRGVVGAVEASSRRLGRRPDLVLYHCPPPYPWTPCKVARLLEEAWSLGLTGYIGVSNFNASQLREAVSCTRRAEIIVDQVHYSLAHRVPEHRLLPTASELGVTIMAWGPLAKGALAGKRKADNMARRLDPVFRAAARDEKLQTALAEAAAKLNTSKAIIALAWLISRGAVPVVGARRRRHVEQAARAAATTLPPFSSR
jgi:aryl-alcohol dehydrogenase-like predicted oxidoreductase